MNKTNQTEEKASETPVKYRTQSAYVSGYITGKMWMPACKSGIPINSDYRREASRFADDSRTTFRDVLSHLLMENGGDFQDSLFSADTVLRVERLAVKGNYRKLHVFERAIAELHDCADLVDADTYGWDFNEEE
jgi:hypothetical protein